MGLFLVAVSLLAGAAYATEDVIEFVVPPGNIEDWEVTRLPIRLFQTLFWVRTEPTNDGVLMLKQAGIHEYTGETEVLVTSNIGPDLSCSITPIC